MNRTDEVLSAFLDGEPFDPQELDDILADANGRAALIDFVALGALVKEHPATPPTATGRPRRRLLSLAAAVFAVVLASAAAGYAVGERQGSLSTDDQPPEPTRVVRVTTDWQ